MKNILFILLTLCAFHSSSFAKAFDLIVTPSHDEEPQEKTIQKLILTGERLLIMISSEALEKAGMGFALGLSAAKKGIEVTYIIGAKALTFAKQKGVQNTFIPISMTPRQMLQKSIENGASIQIYDIYAKMQGLEQADFIQGVKLIPSEEIITKLYTKKSKILSF